MPSLYGLSKAVESLHQMLEASGGDLEHIEQQFEESSLMLREKLRAYGYLIEVAEDEVEQCNRWIERIRAVMESAAARRDGLRKKMAEAMARANVLEVSGSAPPTREMIDDALGDVAERLEGEFGAEHRDAIRETLEPLVDLLLRSDGPPMKWRAQETPGETVIEDLELLRAYPYELFRAPRWVDGTIDKKLVRRLLDQGVPVPGATVRKEWRVYGARGSGRE